MIVTCTGCGTKAPTQVRQGVGRTNPINPVTKQWWWSRRVETPEGHVRLEYACTTACKERVQGVLV